MIDAADTEVLVSTALAAGTSTPPRPTATSPRVGKAIRGLGQHVYVTTKYFNRTGAAAAARRLGGAPTGPARRPRASRLDRLDLNNPWPSHNAPSGTYRATRAKGGVAPGAGAGLSLRLACAARASRPRRCVGQLRRCRGPAPAAQGTAWR